MLTPGKFAVAGTLTDLKLSGQAQACLGRLVRGNDVDKIQAHLPEEPNSFIGRERELGELDGMRRHIRALALCGPGGIGKTRLALRILAVAADEFPDGVCFVELADLRHPDQVASRVAAVTGVSEEAGRPLAETLADAP